MYYSINNENDHQISIKRGKKKNWKQCKQNIQTLNFIMHFTRLNYQVQHTEQKKIKITTVFNQTLEDIHMTN